MRRLNSAVGSTHTGLPATIALGLGLAVCCASAADLAAQPAPGLRSCPEAPAPVLVERGFASQAALEPGDSLELAARIDGPRCPIVIAGMFDPAADPAELTRERPRLIFHLPDLQRLSGRDGEVDRFSLGLAESADSDIIASRVRALMPGTQVLPAETVAVRASTTFQVVRRFHRAIAIITLTAGGVFLACIMVLKVQERRFQVAALRLVGISRRTLLLWLMLEATIVSVLGGMLGIGLGYLASGLINAFYQRAYQTPLRFSVVTPGTLELGLGLAVGLGMAAGLIAVRRLLVVDALAEVGR
jgi:putative ABC transport system permease protein